MSNKIDSESTRCPYCFGIPFQGCEQASQIVGQARSGGLTRAQFLSYLNRIRINVLPECNEPWVLEEALEKGQEVWEEMHPEND